MKTINNNELNIKDVGREVKLHGWVSRVRNLGGVIFIDLRDRSGIVQLVVKPSNPIYDKANTLKSEFVIEVEGKITERESKNKNIPTGDIEVDIAALNALNTAIELPFEITNDTKSLEETRLKYRYLDLRREVLQKNIITRHKIVTSAREYLNNLSFIEVETPILSRSTPEGARDYLVPSRVSKGKFYALPQSPQLYKQLLMVSGFEKYYQIAKCFRDEDLRADRQPEFTQIDIEMSFVDEQDVRDVTENLLKKVMKDVKGIEIKDAIPVMKYAEAMDNYGSDKPDVRFDMQITNITKIFSNTEFNLFKNVIDSEGVINCIIVHDGVNLLSRKDLDNYSTFVKTYGASGLAWLKNFQGELDGSIAKYLSNEEREALLKQLALENNDLIIIIADKYSVTKASLGALRLKLGKELNLIDESKFEFLWIVDFPLFEYDENEKRYYACHHPFTSPKDGDLEKMDANPGEAKAKAYDIVLNGYEIGGGSIRIHRQDIQQKMFKTLGFTEESIKNKFGFLIEAFKYGTPPHGGLALGLERLTMLLCGTDNIRDVMAFPKTSSAVCLMSEAPNIVDEDQLKDLAIKLDNK